MTKNITRRSVLAGAAAMAAAAAFPRRALPQDASSSVVELKVSTFLPGQDALVDILRDWTDEVARRSGGAVRFTYFPSSQMGPVDRQFDLARRGVADISLFIHGNSPGRFPMTELAYLPSTFGGISCESGARIMQDLSAEYLAAEHPGTRLLAISPTPEFVVFSTDRIANFEALAGRRIRHPGAPMADALRTIRAVPVGLPSPEMGDALQKGLVDGLGINWQAAADWRIDEIGREVLWLPLGVVTFCIVMNQARLDALPPAVRAIIDETSTELSVRLGRELDVAEAAAADRLRPICNVTTPEPAEAARFANILSGRRAAWVSAVEARGLPARAYVDRLLDGVREAGGLL